MSEDDRNNQNHNCLAYGIGFGLLGGALSAVILGMLLDTIMVWAFAPGLGILLGMTIGNIMDASEKKK